MLYWLAKTLLSLCLKTTLVWLAFLTPGSYIVELILKVRLPFFFSAENSNRFPDFVNLYAKYRAAWCRPTLIRGSLKLSGNYISHLLQRSNGFRVILTANRDYFLKQTGKVYSVPEYVLCKFLIINKRLRQLSYLDNSSFKLYKSHGLKVFFKYRKSIMTRHKALRDFFLSFFR
jgi:hypothetical protein